MEYTFDTVTVRTPKCYACGKRGVVEVLASDWNRYAAGAYVQVAFPELPKGLREQIVSGTHPACWDAIFGNDD